MLAASCTKSNKPSQDATTMDSPSTIHYENELFSVDVPEDWIIDTTQWYGLEAMQNAVDIFSPTVPISFHFVKVFFPIRWKNVQEAAEMPKTLRALSGDSCVLIFEDEESTQVGGYPAQILYFANFVDNDTIIQKMFVTFLQDSYIVMYLNENFYYRDRQIAETIGDPIIETIRFKKVSNPLIDGGDLNDEAILDATNEAFENNRIDEKYIKTGEKLRNIIEQKEQ